MSKTLTCPHCGSVETTYKKKVGLWECNDCEKRFDSPGEISQRPQRIFLSYGHDDNTPLVQALRERLETAGHYVWIDQTQIKVGDDWRRAIKKGLLDSDRVLSFLSKHSTRDPGVCLDEIGIALAHRHGAIATLLVEPLEQVSPPPSISHIQFLNLSNWREEHGRGEPNWTIWLDTQSTILLDIIARNAGFSGDMDELQRLLTPQTQGGRLGSLIERGFFGRDWLFDEIKQWRINKGAPVFWLVAEPGMGKSAVAARLAHTTAQYTIAYHFCRFDEPATCSPEAFIRSLAFQLAARLPGYRELLLYSIRYHSKPLVELPSDDLFTLLLTNPLRYSIDGGQSEDRQLVIVDGLDEAPAIADLLARRRGELPAWLALLLTSRPDAEVQSTFSGIAPHELATNDPRNQRDLEAYLDQWLLTVKPQLPSKARDTLIKNSDGNLLYLVTAHEGAEAGVFDLNTPDTYPKGLGELYRSWFNRTFADGSNTLNWPASYELLELVCASPEPLPTFIARHILNWRGQDRISAIRPLGSLIQELDDTIQVFHRSLAEWLQDTHQADQYWINVADGRIRLAKALWENLSEISKASNTGYAHRALPSLLLTIPADCRKEIWGDSEQRFLQISRFDEILTQFQEYEIRLARLHLARVYAEECRKYYGEASDESLTAHSNLATLLIDVTSSFLEAKEILESTLFISEHALGSNHPITATCLERLAVVMGNLEEYDEACLLYGRAIAICDKVLGGEHHHTAKVLHDFATLIYTLGEYQTALTLYQRALVICEKALGPDHLSTASALSSLATLMCTLKEYEAAGPMHERALAIHEKVLGPDHPDIVVVLNNLAVLKINLLEYEAAHAMLERAISISKKSLGQDHPTTAVALTNLAELLVRQGQYEGARPLFEHALVTLEKIRGPNHPNTANTLISLASLLVTLNEFNEARPLCERALAICENTFGPDDSITVRILNDLTLVLMKLGEEDLAMPLFERIHADNLRPAIR
jgi:tetratricopeptide (TPR) repeat protein